MNFNLGSFLSGATTGYKFTKEMQAQDEEAVDRKKRRQRDDDRYQRETKSYDDAQAYEQSRKDVFQNWQDSINPQSERPAQVHPRVANHNSPEDGPSASSMASRGVAMPQEAPVITVQPQAMIKSPDGFGRSDAQMAAQPQAQDIKPTSNQFMDLQMRYAFNDLRAGKGDGGGLMALHQTAAKMREEGFDQTMDLLNKGQYQAGFDKFNSTGTEKREFVSAKDGEFVTPTGDKIPTKLVTFAMPDGSTNTISTAQALFQRMKMEDILKIGFESRRTKATEKNADATSANSAETRRHNIATESTDRIKVDSWANGSGHLTPPQQRGNLEIDAAREAVAGMSAQEINMRTAKATNTGRDNPNYDPGLAHQAALASRRKIGVDDWFDQRQGKQQTDSPTKQPTTPRARFDADPAMKGNRMGKMTANGMEVLDADGKHIGYWK